MAYSPDPVVPPYGVRSVGQQGTDGSSAREIVLADGQQVEGADVQFESRRFITGIVYDEGGEPADGAIGHGHAGADGRDGAPRCRRIPADRRVACRRRRAGRLPRNGQQVEVTPVPVAEYGRATVTVSLGAPDEVAIRTAPRAAETTAGGAR